MNPMITSEIIPITYIAGSGGTFLSNFITYAKLNNKNLMTFSTNGNAHSCTLDITTDNKLHSYSTDQLDYLLSKGKGTSDPPYYIPIHYSDKLILDDLVTDKFNKLIRITYTQSDINDIVCAFLGKYHIDERGMTAPIIRSKFSIITSTYNFFLERFKISDSKVLDISWNHLLYNDIDILVNELSNFTTIPKDNFNLENLLNWRSKTLQGIENVKYIIGDSHGIQ